MECAQQGERYQQNKHSAYARAQDCQTGIYSAFSGTGGHVGQQRYCLLDTTAKIHLCRHRWWLLTCPIIPKGGLGSLSKERGLEVSQ